MERTTLKGVMTIETLLKRLGKVERVQRANLAPFTDMLAKFPDMNKAIIEHGAALLMLASKQLELEKSASLLMIKQDELKNNTDEILLLVKHTKSVGGFLARHGPRIIAFILGGFVLSGKIGAETATLFKNLFGFSG